MLRNELQIKSQALEKYHNLPVTTYIFIFCFQKSSNRIFKITLRIIILSVTKQVPSFIIYVYYLIISYFVCNIQYSVFKRSSELQWASVLHALLTCHICQAINFNLSA
jgi:hypothetical protein